MTLGTRPRQRLTVTAACTAQVMMVLDVMIVSVAFRPCSTSFASSPGRLEWVVSAYALALAALIPTGGALGDHFGRRRIFMSGTALFALASSRLCSSVSGGVLIGFPGDPGKGGAVMSSLTLSLIAEAYPPQGQDRPDRTVGRGQWSGRRGRPMRGDASSVEADSGPSLRSGYLGWCRLSPVFVMWCRQGKWISAASWPGQNLHVHVRLAAARLAAP